MSVPLIPQLSSAMLDPASLGSKAKDTPERIHGAASQFESILIAQILKTTQGEDGSGWLGDNEDQAASSTVELATDFLARAMAAKGGLGLGTIISRDLAGVSSSNQETSSRIPPDNQPQPQPVR